jgi:beta-lactamase regulating signal transducer with metallopeptidase domain
VILPASLHGIASLAFERMLYCLAAGSALAGVVALWLRLTPRRNSQTRFAIWFATLLAIVALPFFSAGWRPQVINTVAPGALVTIPVTWAVILVSLWAALALAGVLRIGIGLLRIQRLRRSCIAIDPQLLSADMQEILADFRKTRPVSVLVSQRVDVPTAIGFGRPAVVIPAWLVEDLTAAELKYVVLHELAHLRRRDDWTNLIQKLVKAVLFFHPGVWWIERKLSLDREMACDDAVLLQTSAGRVYAQCLARVAEKRMSRRHMALAQAAVDRVHQLSLRVINILAAPGGDRTTRLWKPAIPLVTVTALLCAFSASQAPQLVGVVDAPVPAITAASLSPVVSPMLDAARSSPAATSKNLIATVNTGAATAGAKMGPAREAALFVPTRYTLPQPQQRKLKLPNRMRAAAKPAGVPRGGVQMIGASFSPGATDASTSEMSVSDQNGQVVFLFMTSQQVTAGSGTPVWRVKTVEVLWLVPENLAAKQIPKKI